jgi:hypothetical protein
MGPFLLKVEPEEFVEEIVEPPARIPVPVSNPLYFRPFPQVLVLNSLSYRKVVLYNFIRRRRRTPHTTPARNCF